MPTVEDNNELLGKLVIPTMPQALQRIREEQAKSEPDLTVITDTVASDVSLAAEVLKVVNSPVFGRRGNLSSIPSAVMLLGLETVLKVVTGVALRDSVGKGCKQDLARFWDSAADVATVSAVLARDLTGLPPDTAYTLGLMRDCGIPILTCRFPDYGEFTARAQRRVGINVADAERQRYGIDHARLGYHVARSWGMPGPVTEAIRHHHHLEVLTERSGGAGEDVMSLVCVLKMAEHVSHSFRGLAFREEEEDPEWNTLGEWVLSYFGMSTVEFADRKDALFDILGSMD